MYVYKYTYLLSYTMEFPLPLSPLISTAHNCYHYLFIFRIVFPPTPILISDLLCSSFLFFLVFLLIFFIQQYGITFAIEEAFLNDMQKRMNLIPFDLRTGTNNLENVSWHKRYAFIKSSKNNGASQNRIKT